MGSCAPAGNGIWTGIHEGSGGCIGQQEARSFWKNVRDFGHPGAVGSLAFADPDRGVGFAYVMNQLELSAFPTAKVLAVVDALYGVEESSG